MPIQWNTQQNTQSSGINWEQTPMKEPPAPLSTKIWNKVGIVKDARVVKDALKSGIEQVKQGYSESRNATSALGMAEGSVKATAGVFNTVFSPLAPVFKPVGDAINYVADKIADIPGVQKFAQTKAGEVTERVAETAGNLSVIAGGTAALQTLPGQVQPVKKLAGDLNTLRKQTFSQTPEKIINKRVEVLKQIDNQYSKMRTKGAYDKDHEGTLKRVASTDVLSKAVDENGVIRTKQPGGAVENYTSQTLDGAENVIRKNLERTGEVVSPGALSQVLKAKINSNTQLQGKARTTALKNVDAEVAGYPKDANGNIPLTAVQDAKVATYKIVKDYATPAEYKTYQKALGQGLKTAIEDNSLINISEINAEMAKYLQDVAFLERLDGTRVSGGKLGKYFAQVSGNIIGGAAGSAIGGPVGTAAGTIIGGELASRMKGSALQRSLAGETGFVAPENPIIKKAVDTGNSPRLGLPAPAEGAPRTQIGSGQTINLGSRTQTLSDKILQENILGNRNTQYSPTKTTTKKVIEPKSTTALQEAQLPERQPIRDSLKSIKEYKKMLSDPKSDSETLGFAKRGIEGEESYLKGKGISKDLIPLVEEAQKYKSAEEFVKAQGETLYHGSKTKYEQFDLSKADKGGLYGNSAYMTPTARRALSYGDNVTEYIVPKNAKLLKESEFERRVNSIVPSVPYRDITIARGKAVEQFIKEGYDGVKVGDTTAIFNQKALQTKSQLTDIWNKANNKK